MSTGSQASKQVIRAVQMFSKDGGKSSQVSAAKEIGVGLVLGVGAGLLWQTYHWSENDRWDKLMKKP
jgi:Mg/Co/Ni transporter MgtE